jgi:hypothetical protein
LISVNARHRYRAASLALLAIIPVAAATAKPKPKPPKPPKPEITLLTRGEIGALRREAIKLGVEAKRTKKVTVKADFVVDGYPEDYAYRLGPVRKRIRDGDAKVNFGLSPRQLEVLDFAAKTCRGASLSVTAKTAKRTGRLRASLKLPPDC